MKKLIFLIFLFMAFPLFSETVYFIQKADFTEMVDLSYANLIYRTIKQAEKAKASTLIIELNTPGGRVDAAIKIKNFLLNTKLKIIIFINNEAISAGALISLCGEKIYITPGGVMGASTPVYQKGDKMEAAEEKAVSVMRAEMRSLAEKYNRSGRITEAMVDADIVLTRDRDGLDLEKGKLLTLTAKEALRLKIADKIVTDDQALLKDLALHRAEIITVKPKPSDRVLSFLNHPFLTGILLTLGMLGLIFEVKTPGWGVGGTVGILCLALFFISQIMAGYANWGAPVLFLIGMTLLAVEIFIIPGFGLVGVSGITAIMISFFMSFDDLQRALWTISGALFATGIGTFLIFKYAPRTRIFNRLVLNMSEDKKDGYHASSDKLQGLLGKKGKVLTTLRPVGTAEINGKPADVMSEGEFIEKGSEIKVIAVEGNRVVVKKI